ncbi:MAG: hypothetical protein KGR26_15650, partial [Cyanobacteria bacterium REEB65]|nr:hypothetical protein [Cyanobacteria bacterium REEB65]
VVELHRDWWRTVYLPGRALDGGQLALAYRPRAGLYAGQEECLVVEQGRGFELKTRWRTLKGR